MLFGLPGFIRHYIVIVVTIGVLAMRGGVWASNNQGTSLQFTIRNSYSGSLNLLAYSGTWLLDQDHVWRTDQYQANLRIVSDSDTSYQVSGDMIGSPIVSSGVGPYTHDFFIDLLSGQNHNISAIFMKDWEPLTTDPLTISVDAMGPAMPGLYIANNTILSGEILLQRSGVVDTGIGLSHYMVFMGSTPGLGSMVAIMTTGTSIQISGSLLPPGTIYRTVVAIDKLGNQSDYVVGYFHHGSFTVVSQFGGGGGGSAGSDSIYDSSATVPVYVPDDGGNYNVHHVATCKGRRISHLRDCMEWDRLNLSITSPIESVRTWDDLPTGVTRLGIVETTNLVLDSNLSEELDEISTPAIPVVQITTFVPNIKTTTDLYRDTGAWDGLLFSDMQSDLSSETHESAGLIELLFDKYICERTNYCAESYSNLVCEYINYCGEPNPNVYESTIRQYGENVVSRTKVFSRYTVLITMSLVMMSGWFFMLGYHHHYVIKYLK